VTLSTVRPSGQTRPTEPWPQLLRIEDPAAPQPKVVMRSMAQADMAEEAPVIMAETAAQASFDGPSVTYVYPGTVDVASDADAVRLALGEIALAPKIRAVAVPSRDTTAYLMAGFTNDTAELILPTSAASFYLDGTYVGTQYTDMIAAGADAKLSFGPIEGVQLERTVLSKSEGDRGVISKSNQQREQVRIDVTNLTSEPWDVRLLDQVPYSEQDDLLIQWSATPKVSEQDVDGKRGILAWDFALPAGASQQIMLDQTIDWPIDKVLR